MKLSKWTNSVVGILAVSLTIGGLTASRDASAAGGGGRGGGGGGGGGHQGGGGGGGGHQGGGGGGGHQGGGGGGGARPGNFGGGHAPGSDGRQHSPNGNPGSFNHGGPGGQAGFNGGRPNDGRGPSFYAGNNGFAHPGGSPGRPGNPGNNFNQARVGNQPFRNSVQFSNRNFNLGSNSYQPAYARHSGYHGYWNGNRAGAGAAGLGLTGNGLGVNRGFGSNLGLGNSGLGWGLGNALGLGGGYGGLGGLGGYGSGLGGYGGYGGYGSQPFGWGMGGWGLGSMLYNSGYLGYSNPFLNNGLASGGFNYAQPIPVAYNAPVDNTALAANDTAPESADDILNQADAAFKQNDYATALAIADRGITQYPDDAVLHEFRALALFATKDYQSAAATIHSVLAVGPGWDWTTLSGMYSDVDNYTQQLRALESYTQQNPTNAAAQFLLAYHYMSTGHSEAAAAPLQQVVQLVPNDRLAVDLLKMVSPPPTTGPGELLANQPATPAQPAAATQPAAKPVDPATLVGTWHAQRADGSKFDLTLSPDKNFTWRFAGKDQAPQEFGGAYAVDGNVLALERTNGGSLFAAVAPTNGNAFDFKMLGAPSDDPGLHFNH